MLCAHYCFMCVQPGACCARLMGCVARTFTRATTSTCDAPNRTSPSQCVRRAAPCIVRRTNSALPTKSHVDSSTWALLPHTCTQLQERGRGVSLKGWWGEG
jgi:hypothetical protein